MSLTQRYKDQHTELRRCIETAKPIIQSAHHNQVKDLEKLVVEFCGKLMVHLAMEETLLFPSLFESNSEKLRVLTTRYSNELISVKLIVSNFLKRWSSSTFIGRNMDNFRMESVAFFDAIESRMQSEETELYPLAEKYGPGLKRAA